MYLIDGLLTLGYRYRIITLLIVAIFSLLAWQGLAHLTVDTDLENLISSNVNRALYDELNEEFNVDGVTVVFVQDKNLFSVEKLEKLKALEQALMAHADVEKIDSVFTTNSLKTSGVELVNAPIIENLPETQAQADVIYKEAVEHPLLQGTLVSSDGQSTALNVTIIDGVDSTKENVEFYDELQDILRDYQYEFDNIFQMGDPRLTSVQYRSIFKDLFTLGPISLLLLISVLFLFFLNASSFVLPAVTAGISLLWTFGFMGYVGIPVNLLIVMLPTLVIVMGATEDTHMLSSYLEMFDEKGSTAVTRRTATQFMMKKVSLPVILAAVTTWFGFAVSQFSSITMIKQFAQAASFSFLANAVVTILLVPCYLATVGPKPKRGTLLFNPYEGMATVVMYIVKRHPVFIIMICSLITGIMLVLAGRVYVNTAPLSFFHQHHDVVQDADQLHEELAGISSFFVTLELDDKQAFKEPNNLNTVKDTVDIINSYEEIDFATGLTDYIIYINQEAHQGDEAYAAIPDNQQEVEQYLEYFREDDLSKFVNKDYTRVNIVVRHNINNSRDLDALLLDIDGVLQEELPEYVTYHITGKDLLINASVSELLKSQIISIAYLIIAIFLIISVLFTSKLAGAIAMIPNLVPIVILFGLMGLFGMPLNPGTTLVAVILISIAVDDTIHLFHAYIHECRREMDNDQAIMNALKTQFRPVITTSFALAIGFGSLMFSDIKINASFGMLAAISILLAMICDLLLTPVILSGVRIVSLYNILSMHLIKGVVQKSLLFEDMSPYEVKKAILLCTMREYKLGDNIIVQGQDDNEMYLIVKGQVAVYRENEDGKTQQIAELQAGEIFGEMAYIRKIQRTATVQATAPTSLILFNEKQLSMNMRAHPKLAYKMSLNIARILSARLEATTQKVTT